MIAYSFLSTLVCLGLLNSKSALAGPSQWERLLSITQSQETEIDLYGNGQIDLKRTFGPNGRVLNSWHRYPDHSIEEYHESPDGIHRASHWAFPDGTWKLVDETWWNDNAWSLREVLHGQTGKAAERRSVSRVAAPVITTDWYRADASGWQLISTETRPMAMLIGTPGLPPPAEAASLNACPWSTCQGDNRFCFRYQGMYTGNLAALTTVTPLECRGCDNRDLSLSNGFRIDLTTCGASAENLAWARKTSTDMMKVLQCAAGFDPALGAHVLEVVRRAEPRIRCLGDVPSDKLAQACNESPDPAGCVKMSRNGDAGAFQMNPSADLNLTGKRQSTTGGYLASNLVHELLHAAQIPHDENLHNLDDDYFNSLPAAKRTDDTRRRLASWRKTDPVYGINMLCGGEPAGSQSQLSGNAYGEIDKAIQPGDSIPRPDGSMFTPPGSAYELACSALLRVRPGKDAWDPIPHYSLFNQTSVDPTCHARALNLQKQADALKEEKRKHDAEAVDDLNAIFAPMPLGAPPTRKNK